MPDANSNRLSLRPIEDSDLPFLCRVYASTRAEELAVTGWPREQIDAFLEMQFNAQHAYYQQNYPGSHFSVILLQDHPVGRHYLARWKEEFRLIDIALLPEFRRRGIGGRLLAALMEEASSAGLPIRLHVENYNPAYAWYRRLGFRDLEDRGVYQFLEWNPRTDCDL